MYPQRPLKSPCRLTLLASSRSRHHDQQQQDSGCFGRGGAGKTTLFRKLGGYDAGHLHEDLIMVGEGKVYNFPSQSSFSQWEMCTPKSGKLGKIVLLGEREGVGRTSEVQSQDRMQWLMKSIVASHGLEGNASATLDISHDSL